MPQDSADFHWSGNQIDSVASQSHTWDLVAVVAAAAAGCTAAFHRWAGTSRFHCDTCFDGREKWEGECEDARMRGCEDARGSERESESESESERVGMGETSNDTTPLPLACNFQRCEISRFLSAHLRDSLGVLYLQ